MNFQATEQVIRRGECYTLPEFKRRAGLTQRSYRAAVAAGLRVASVGTRKFVRGDDWLDHLESRFEAAS